MTPRTVVASGRAPSARSRRTISVLPDCAAECAHVPLPVARVHVRARARQQLDHRELAVDRAAPRRPPVVRRVVKRGPTRAVRRRARARRAAAEATPPRRDPPAPPCEGAARRASCSAPRERRPRATRGSRARRPISLRGGGGEGKRRVRKGRGGRGERSTRKTSTFRFRATEKKLTTQRSSENRAGPPHALLARALGRVENIENIAAKRATSFSSWISPERIFARGSRKKRGFDASARDAAGARTRAGRRRRARGTTPRRASRARRAIDVFPASTAPRWARTRRDPTVRERRD